MNIADLFDQMGWPNPKQYNMSGAQFAAFLLRNPKQIFFVDIHMSWGNGIHTAQLRLTHLM